MRPFLALYPGSREDAQIPTELVATDSAFQRSPADMMLHNVVKIQEEKKAKAIETSPLDLRVYAGHTYFGLARSQMVPFDTP